MSDTTEPKKNQKKRNNILTLLTLIFLLMGGGYALYYFLYGQYYESTDDAYVNQNIIYVTPQTSGIVDQVFVNKTQYVKAGEQLGRLDTRDAKLSYEQAKAALAQSVRKIHELHIKQKEAQASIALAQVKVNKAKGDLTRNKVLAKHNALAVNTYEHFKYTYQEANQNLQVMRQKLKSIQALIKDANISKNPEVQNAILQVKRSYLNLQRCNIVAPYAGVIAKKDFSIGENVGLDSTLLAIVPTQGFWVDANFKETQIRHMKIGQKVTLTSDLYGSSVTYNGKIVGISPGTGAVFSLLPAQNATGNWIKIVQRVPVRIKLDAKELQKHPLHVGNSMVATVDIRKQSGKAVITTIAPEKKYISSPLYKNAMKEADIITQQIIRRNL